jgi:hypothetical protein
VGVSEATHPRDRVWSFNGSLQWVRAQRVTASSTLGHPRDGMVNSRTKVSGMNSADPLDTPEKINAAMVAMTEAMPGWVPPAAYGVALVAGGTPGIASARFPVVNVGVHGFPALALGEITGRRDETATYVLSADQLERAVAIVAPAEAATMYQHPNLRSWRNLLADMQGVPDGQIVAVFIASFDDPVSSPHDQALREQIADGERAELYR